MIEKNYITQQEMQQYRQTIAFSPRAKQIRRCVLKHWNSIDQILNELFPSKVMSAFKKGKPLGDIFTKPLGDIFTKPPGDIFTRNKT